MAKINVVTLTVDADAITTSVHPDMAAAENSLQENFNADGEYQHPSVDLQPLLDGQGICIYLDEHDVEIAGVVSLEQLSSAALQHIYWKMPLNGAGDVAFNEAVCDEMSRRSSPTTTQDLAIAAAGIGAIIDTEKEA